MLHVYGQAAAAVGGPHAASGEETPSSSAVVNVVSAGRSGSGAPKMPIVPVKVKCRGGPAVDTYAFLDSGSSSSFCSRDLARRLGITLTNEARLAISTVAEEPLNVLTSVIEGLTIGDMDGNHLIHLPAVFALDRIPAGREEVCRPEDLEDWPHLQDVIPGEIDADVGLLIGFDVPTALEPVDVLPSRDGGPFAVKTRLGWVVNGPIRHQKRVEMKSSAYRISVELHAQQLDGDDEGSDEQEGVVGTADSEEGEEEVGESDDDEDEEADADDGEEEGGDEDVYEKDDDNEESLPEEDDAVAVPTAAPGKKKLLGARNERLAEVRRLAEYEFVIYEALLAKDIERLPPVCEHHQCVTPRCDLGAHYPIDPGSS